ncbi:MAG: hypothetical protein Q4P14_02360 [Methanobacteriaceae archaeon]|nr:hypothetical protein [Methanobacteriaceae archaeon]
MEYKINNAIIKKNRETGEFALIDPEGTFSSEDKLMVINNEDFITMQLLINAILRNEFKDWKSVNWDDNDKLKSLLVKLGYTRNDITKMLQEF